MALKFGSIHRHGWRVRAKDYLLIEHAAKLGFDFIELSYGENETVFDPKVVKKLLDDNAWNCFVWISRRRPRHYSTESSVREMGFRYFRNAAETARSSAPRVHCPLYAEIFFGRPMSAESARRGGPQCEGHARVCQDLRDHG